MKNSNTHSSIKDLDLPTLLGKAGHTLSRHAVVLFVVLVAAAYGFVLFSVDELSNVQPSSSAIATQTQPALNVNPVALQQIQMLQNNSVNVQALFNQARSSPFQE